MLSLRCHRCAAIGALPSVRSHSCLQDGSKRRIRIGETNIQPRLGLRLGWRAAVGNRRRVGCICMAV